MKGISIAILICFTSLGFSQEQIFGERENKKVLIAGHTNLIGSYYHLGSYSKERPFGFIEQTIEIIPKKISSLRFGIGSGFNLYPGTAVVPIFATFRYFKNIKERWAFSIVQSYGRNIKTGSIGFNSNRYYGDFEGVYFLNPSLSLTFGMGYIMNWDRWGGKSLSFTGSLGLYYTFYKVKKRRQN